MEREAAGALLASVIAAEDKGLYSHTEASKKKNLTEPLYFLYIHSVFYSSNGLFASHNLLPWSKSFFLPFQSETPFLSLSFMKFEGVSSWAGAASDLSFWRNSKFVSSVKLHGGILDTSWMDDTTQQEMSLSAGKPFLTQRELWQGRAPSASFREISSPEKQISLMSINITFHTCTSVGHSGNSHRIWRQKAWNKEKCTWEWVWWLQSAHRAL